MSLKESSNSTSTYDPYSKLAAAIDDNKGYSSALTNFYGIYQFSQNNKNIKIIEYLKNKGLSGEDIVNYLDSVGALDESTKGSDIKLSDAKNYFENNYTVNEDGTVTANATNTGFEDLSSSSGLDAYKDYIDSSLATSAESQWANQYKSDMYGSINAAENASNASLAAAELQSYRTLGQQQLQLESQIAEQRMNALKSGTTSAQLASQQLANMFAAQSAAQQVASQTQSSRADMANTYNQQRAAVTSDMYNILANNQATKANAYAQLGAAQASYNSYIQQPYAQYQAALQLYNQNPSAYKAINTTYTKNS